MKSDLYDVALIKVRETDKAILFKEMPESDPFWVPKSLIEVEPTKHPKIFMVTMPQHVAEEKGII